MEQSTTKFTIHALCVRVLKDIVYCVLLSAVKGHVPTWRNLHSKGMSGVKGGQGEVKLMD